MLIWPFNLIYQLLFKRKRILDAVVRFDPMNKKYSVRKTIPEGAIPKSVKWPCKIHLNQGTEGACTGFAMAHEIAAEPLPILGVSNSTAHEFYSFAKKHDQWAGEDYDGSSVEGVMKAGKILKYYDEYRWAFSLEDLKLALSHCGPAVLAIPWKEGMAYPNITGRIKSVGKITGYHAILCNGYDLKKDRFTLHNSWGRSWGINSECHIDAQELWLLLKQNGCAAIPIVRMMDPRK